MPQKRPNWRSAYHQMFCSHLDQYRVWLDSNPRMRVDYDGRLVALEELRADELEDLCWREAERDANRAIHEWNADRDQ